MIAKVTYNENGDISSFIAKGNRTMWYFGYQDGTATLRRVEIDKDDHSTDDAVVLFGAEWSETMEYVNMFNFVDSVKIEEPINEG